MSFTEEEAARAIEFARELKISADTDTTGNLIFSQSSEIPDSYHDDIRQILDICIDYHQRAVLTGEYVSVDSNPPLFRSPDKPLNEINFLLNHYRHMFVKEVMKGLDLSEPAADEEKPKRKMTPFVKAMLKHRAQQRKNQ